MSIYEKIIQNYPNSQFPQDSMMTVNLASMIFGIAAVNTKEGYVETIRYDLA